MPLESTSVFVCVCVCAALNCAHCVCVVYACSTPRAILIYKLRAKLDGENKYAAREII